MSGDLQTDRPDHVFMFQAAFVPSRVDTSFWTYQSLMLLQL